MVAAASLLGRLAECRDVEITGVAQHDAWQARTLPPVEQLRADLWSIPVPIPHNPLRYVSVHAFALEGGGLGLLDTGWESDEGWTALTNGLTSIGGGLADVRGVLVTHLHFDHLGLATGSARRPARGRHAPGRRDPRCRLERPRRRRGGRARGGVPRRPGRRPGRRRLRRRTGRHMERFTRMAVPDRLLEDGGIADFPGWRMRAVHTPGHTPGHLCFVEERTGLFFSGDHVLPRISPNISTGAAGAADPLRDYLDSLGAVRDLDPVEVLPAHEWRFRGLAERVDALTAHHEQRLAELLDGRPRPPARTPWELAAHLTWSRPWAQYERRMRIFAVTETDAHLRLLASRGLVDRQRRPGADLDPRRPVRRFAGLAERFRAAPPRLGSTRLVCVDGPAGSGKTTFTAPAGRRAGARRRRRPPRRPLRRLDPHRRGRPAVCRRAPAAGRGAGRPVPPYDWTTRRFSPAPIPVPARPVLLVEGCGSGARALDPVRSLLVWVEAPRPLRIERGLARTGPTWPRNGGAGRPPRRPSSRREDTRARADLRDRRHRCGVPGDVSDAPA